MLGANDTAVAVAHETKASRSDLGTSATDSMTPLDKSVLAKTTEMVGATLSERWLVTRKIGQGGMGAVYEATHTMIGKQVAIKILLDKYANRESIVARLKKEAELASSIRHPHIIDITDIGQTEDGRTFVVMEYLEGESLAECLARETRLPEQRILRIISQAAGALAAANEKGIVHRDIKPENLFLLRRNGQDFVKVVDFGISKSLRASDEQEEQPRLTQTGMVLGTPLYMSPEQARGDETLDHRVDVYALGVIMYEASTGQVPFVGSNYLSVISQVLNEEPKPPRMICPELSEEFEAIVMRAMAKDRDERYATANDLNVDLTALLDDPSHSTERAKITGPRRKALQRKVAGIKIAVWIAVVLVIVAAVTVIVKVTMSGTEKPNAAKVIDAGVAVMAPPSDAAVAVEPPVDAAPPKPVGETIDVRLVSVPAGARVVGEEDGRLYCETTPCTFPFEIEAGAVKLVMQLNGFDDQKFGVRPVVQKKKNDPVVINMKKAVGRPPTQVKVPPPTGDTHTPDKNTTNGEIGTNPYRQPPK